MVNVTGQVWVAILVFAAALGLSATGQAAAVDANAATLANMQTAFNGESNANARYKAFARKADAEGYTQVASLFRAAAEAEQIHAAAHAKVIAALGGKATADVKAPEVKTTAENLKAALEGETYERDTMYPAFITEATAGKLTAAVRSLTLAKTAEAEHAKLYKSALDNLEQWRGGAKPFYVCSVCGFTSIAKISGKCPSCFSPADKFIVVE